MRSGYFAIFWEGGGFAIAFLTVGFGEPFKKIVRMARTAQIPMAYLNDIVTV